MDQSLTSLIGIIGALGGTIIGWLLNLGTDYFAQKKRKSRELKAASMVCLDRLLKIKSAKNRKIKKQINDEILYLGKDLDRLRDVLAEDLKNNKKYWTLYKKLKIILLEHDLTKLDACIKDLERNIK